MTAIDDTGPSATGATAAGDTGPAATGTELVVAVWRRRWLWLLVAVMGLVAGLALRGVPAALWPSLAYAVVVCVTLAAVDLRYHRLPDVLTLGSCPVVAALLLIPAVADSRFSAWTRACVACLAVVLALFVLGRVLGYGAGDAKLAGLLAMPLAWHSWAACLAGLWAGFLATSLFGGLLMAMGRIRRRDKFAAGPPLMVGAYVVLVLMS